MTTTTTDGHKLDYQSSRPVQDPEQYRMSIGEHLEELRWRLILALVGFISMSRHAPKRPPQTKRASAKTLASSK